MNPKQEFQQQNPNYPASLNNLTVELMTVSDSDVPSGSGGINREGYTYGQLRRQPIIPEVLRLIRHPRLRAIAEECNRRNADGRFTMFKVGGEWCFWRLRVGEAIPAPTVAEMRAALMRDPRTAAALATHSVTSDMIRGVTYNLYRDHLARRCGLTPREAAEAIGNQLVSIIHEDLASGHIYLVPEWAHRWFRHDGYAAAIRDAVKIIKSYTTVGHLP